MTDLAQLESQILADIAAAGDEAALEAVRVSALGKKGSISALLATLGKMSPDERKTQGAAINLAKDKVSLALTARRDILKSAALDARLASETIDVTLPLREAPAEAGRIHPLSQVFEEVNTIFADMGFAIAEGPDIETDDYNFTKLNFPEGHPAREIHDTFFFNPGEDGRHAVAHAYVAGASAHDAEPKAADPRGLPGPHLSHRFRCDAYAAVPSGRGPRHRQGLASRPPQMDPARVLQGVLRGRPHRRASWPVVLPVHRALARSRHPALPARQGRNPVRRRRGLAGNSRLRHGASEPSGRGNKCVRSDPSSHGYESSLRAIGQTPPLAGRVGWGSSASEVSMADEKSPTWKVSSKLRSNARAHRKNSTDAERILVGVARSSAERRKLPPSSPIKNFIADFVCHAAGRARDRTRWRTAFFR